MRSKFTAALRCGGLALMVPLLGLGGAPAQAADARFEAQLIWATNDKKSPNPNHKQAEAEVRKRLAKLPLKWANYFEVNRSAFTVSLGGTNRAVMSEKASIEVKLLDARRVEVSLHGKKGDVCTKHTQPMPKDEILVFGGESPGENAWLLTLKRTD